MKVFLLLILSSIILLYIPLNRQKPRFNFKIKLDDLIPLIPWTVWIYVSYYLLLPMSVLLIWSSSHAIAFFVTQIISTAFASLIWKIFPNGVVRPTINNHSNINHRILNLIYNHDKDCNGLPSGHVLHSFVSCYYLAKVFPQAWILFVGILFAISISTLTIKQHYYIDMVATLLLTPILIEISTMVI